MNNTGRKPWARVGVNRKLGAIDEGSLSGPVKSYKLPPSEIERIFQNVKPEPRPEPVVTKARCKSMKLKRAGLENEDVDISLDGGIDVDEIERIEAGAMDPLFKEPFTEEDYIDSEWGGPFDK